MKQSLTNYYPVHYSPTLVCQRVSMFIRQGKENMLSAVFCILSCCQIEKLAEIKAPLFLTSVNKLKAPQPNRHYVLLSKEPRSGERCRLLKFSHLKVQETTLHKGCTYEGDFQPDF